MAEQQANDASIVDREIARIKQEFDSLPENQLRGDAITRDGKTVTAKVSVQKTWRNGFGLGAYVKGIFGNGRQSDYEAGVEAKWKLGDKQ